MSDPLGIHNMFKSPKKPEKTAQEKAAEIRQTMALNKAIDEEEKRLKALRRGSLGNASLLGDATATARQAASRGVVASSSASSSGGGRSLMGGSSRTTMNTRLR